MTAEERDFISSQFKSTNEKIDLVTGMINDKVDGVEETIYDHGKRIGTLEAFKEGHQEVHKEKDKTAGNRQFSLSQWIVVGLCVFTVLSDKFF